MKQPVILTGLRANSDLTLGNYFGGIKPIVDMAKKHAADYRINMFIPDLHSFTTPINHAALYEQILHNARVFVAAGLPIDNDNIALYRQSFIPAHSELTWILDCFTGFGEMSRMTQFKDKAADLTDDRISVGLFNYPVLMAVDVLLYDAKYVPVGDDQTQHLEFTRDIALRMNARFGDLFTVPESVAKQNQFFGKNESLRIKDLQNPHKKMSKSDESGRGVIYLNDSPSAAAKKVMSAATDSLAEINFDRSAQPGITNLLEILALLTETPVEEVVTQYKGSSNYGDFKKQVASQVENFLSDFQSKLSVVDDQKVINKLEKSEDDMQIVAKKTLLKVQRAVGLRQTE